jgi:hypothetical protein
LHRDKEAAMDARDGRIDEPAIPAPVDRRDRDGDAGTGDMLGGLSTGAGGTLGVDLDGEQRRFDPGPISGHQHSFDDVEPRTDAAENYHGLDNPA